MCEHTWWRGWWWSNRREVCQVTTVQKCVLTLVTGDTTEHFSGNFRKISSRNKRNQKKLKSQLYLWFAEMHIAKINSGDCTKIMFFIKIMINACFFDTVLLKRRPVTPPGELMGALSCFYWADVPWQLYFLLMVCFEQHKCLCHHWLLSQLKSI